MPDPLMTVTLSRCFRCGSTELDDKRVEELVRQGRYVVALRVPADVCSRCGERYFAGDSVRMFENVKQRIERGDLEGFQVTGELLEPVGTPSK